MRQPNLLFWSKQSDKSLDHSVRTLESLYYIGVTLATHPDATSEELVVRQWMPYEDANNRLTPTEALQNILDYLDKVKNSSI